VKRAAAVLVLLLSLETSAERKDYPLTERERKSIKGCAKQP
jgi:hypothetical protein